MGQGRLLLTSRRRCRIAIDDTPRGATPLNLVLPVGDHAVRVTRPDLGLDETIAVHVFSRAMVRRSIEFE